MQLKLPNALFVVLGCGVCSGQPVDFAASIHPIFAAKCNPCHSGDSPRAGLSFASREALLKGGRSGPALVPGKASASLLIARVTGKALPAMPMGGTRLSDAEIKLLSDWIDQNAPWTDVTPKPSAVWDPPLAPRRPEVPQSAFPNPIDRFVDAYFRSKGLAFPSPVSDNLFVRRVYMDAWGIVPSAAQVTAFLEDRDPRKREKTVDRLLADSKMYTGNWISFWNDLLRNDQGVNYAGTRQTITPWLEPALESNMPYDKMVAELVNPGKNGPAGFLLGVNWRGDVNASQTPYMQAAQNTAQVFLGVNLKCASCHDSFINRYQLKQSYGMAALFAEQNELELVRCDVKTGRHTGPEFLFPEIGTVPSGGTVDERRAAAAKLFTAPENGRLARTMVNRVWARFFGRGLVDPVDEMDLKPWNPDLLDWLAVDFSDHGYDLKYLMRQIMDSRTYQLPSIPGKAAPASEFTFLGPRPRRLTAEQFVDTLSSMTGEWRVLQADDRATFAREWQLKSTPLSRELGRPIRDQVVTARNPDATMLQALELVNGDTMGLMVRRGAKRLLGQLPSPPAPLFDSKTLRKNSADLDIDLTGVNKLWLVITDVDCYDPSRTVAAWADVELTGDQGSTKLSSLTTLSKIEPRAVTSKGKEFVDALAPGVPSTLIYDIGGLGFKRMRGHFALDDSSNRADISPAVRGFVFAAEPDRHQLIAVSADPPLPAPPVLTQPDKLIDDLFLEALCRKPTTQEAQIARSLLAPQGKTSEAGLEDLLWCLLMLPETQYIY